MGHDLGENMPEERLVDRIGLGAEETKANQASTRET